MDTVAEGVGGQAGAWPPLTCLMLQYLLRDTSIFNIIGYTHILKKMKTNTSIQVFNSIS